MKRWFDVSIQRRKLNDCKGNKTCMRQIGPINRLAKRDSAALRRLCLKLLLLGSLTFFTIGGIEFVPSATAASADEGSKTPEQMEYEVKAAFIFNFMKFIQWPSQKNITANGPAKSEPIRIVILGNNPFKSAFEQVLNKNVQGRSIALVELESFEKFRRSYPDNQAALDSYRQAYLGTLQQSHMLFICESEKNSVQDLLGLIAGSGLVTVSDLADFAEKQGMIGFVMENQKVRFEVNLYAAQQENVKISSQLLGLARRVYKKEGKS